MSDFFSGDPGVSPAAADEPTWKKILRLFAPPAPATPAPAPISPPADWRYWLNPFNYDPGPAFRQGQAVEKGGEQAVANAAASWVVPFTDWVGHEAPIAGVFLLLALLFLLSLAVFLTSGRSK